MVALNYYYDFFVGSFLFGLIAASRGIQLLVRDSYQARLGAHAGVYRSRRRCWPWLLGIAAGTCIMVVSELPLHISFFVSRPWLDRIADEALADPANAHLLAGRVAGLYQISGVEVIGNTVVLYIGKDRGNYGFARVPGTTSSLISNDRDVPNNPHDHRDFPRREGFRDPEGKRIMGNWFVMYSSYMRVKVGWS